MDDKKSFISLTSGLSQKDYIGYALGDFAGVLCFSTVTTILQKYYTDVYHLTPLFIMIMFVVARVWDAINDPIMGRIVDNRKATKDGRYRVWMKWIAIPLAIITILLFLPWPSLVDKMGAVGIAVYATITYILFGMTYTVHQIPYGSLASVVTTDVKERNKLSVFRAAGAAIGSIPVLVITMIYAEDKLDAAGNPVYGENGKIIQEIQYLPVIIGVVIMALLGAALLYLAYKWNKERVLSLDKPAQTKGQTKKIFKVLITNKSFLGVSIVGLLLLASQMFTQSFYTYLFNDLFAANWMNMVSMVCTYGPMAIIMFFAGKLVRKFGKKEVCGVGAAIAAIANLALFLLKDVIIATPVLFLVFCLISGIGLSIITLELWALATDAIDDVEVKTGERNDGSSYSLFNFFRKLGQVVAAIAVNAALMSMSYKSEAGAVQTAETLNSMYDMATLIPAAMFILMSLALFLVYGLNKKKTAELQIKKEEILKEKVENNTITINN